MMFPKTRSTIIEIVGPAGAGKTTLARALSHYCSQVQVGIGLSKIKYIPFLVNNTFLMLAIFLHYRRSRWFTWSETRSMVYLEAWLHALGPQARDTDLITILDHGPIFRLASLSAFGPELTQSQLFKRWWNRVLEQWSEALKIIIWLDAPDAVLLARIRSRDRKHVIKGKSDEQARDFLVRYRTAYERVIARMTANGGPTVLCFDTSETPVDKLLRAVITGFDA